MKFATVRDLSRNPSEVIDSDEPVVITKNGQPRKLVIPFDEDMLLLNDPAVQSSIKKSRQARARGSKGESAKELLESI